jgi:uncharacterized protein YbjQ (UPF0145 family)
VPYRPGSQEGLPEAARRRLTAMRRTSERQGLFTSDLSVNEFLLVREAGFDPLGLVMGSSIYHVGFQTATYFQNQELQVLSQAMYHARDLAMTRMEEEADMLGADGIVGVRLEVTHHQWGVGVAEFVAIGTAIRHREGQPYRTASSKPFTSDLSGQDFWSLLRAGYRPLSFVMGTCVYHVAHQGLRQTLKQMGRNIEMQNYTQALYDARELALSRMQAEAATEQAEGIVGVEIREHCHSWGFNVIEFLAVGTAVAPITAEHVTPAPSLVLTLNR